MMEIQKRLKDMDGEEICGLATKNWLDTHPETRTDNLLWTRILHRRGCVLQLWRNTENTKLNYSITRITEDRANPMHLRLYAVMVFPDELAQLWAFKPDITKEFNRHLMELKDDGF